MHGNFPTGTEYMNCPICGEFTSYFMGEEPDPDYAEKIATHQEHHVAATESPDIPCVPSTVKVKHEDGALWMHVWDLYAHGIRHRLQPDHLIRVGKQTFEVVHYVEDRRSYLVRPFSLELSDYDMHRLADG